MLHNFSLRKAEPTDIDFFVFMHHHCLRDYVEPVWGWDESVQDQFAKKEFSIEATKIIEKDDRDIGCVVVRQFDDHTFLSNLWIHEGDRNCGVGTSVIKKIIHLSENQKRPVRLHVLNNNRSKSLYDRLGFKFLCNDEESVGVFMEYCHG